MNEQNTANPFFISLVISLSQAALTCLGKIKHPSTNEVSIDLEQAKLNIDMLDMLKEKTKNNLTNDEEKMFNDMLSDLKLTYVDVTKK